MNKEAVRRMEENMEARRKNNYNYEKKKAEKEEWLMEASIEMWDAAVKRWWQFQDEVIKPLEDRLEVIVKEVSKDVKKQEQTKLSEEELYRRMSEGIMPVGTPEANELYTEIMALRKRLGKFPSHPLQGDYGDQPFEGNQGDQPFEENQGVLGNEHEGSVTPSTVKSKSRGGSVRRKSRKTNNKRKGTKRTKHRK